ncbi:MAG: FMN-binding negative transcriptional regulator [Candidatus Limnocylindrales bacterium]
MLIRPYDRAIDEAEWRSFVTEHDFGQLIVPVAGGLPVVVPTHFVLDPGGDVAFHLARENPAFTALEEVQDVLFTIIGAYTYIPTDWNANPGADPLYGIPTSYYAAVQIAARATVVDDPDELAAILRLQLGHFQPQGGHAPVEPGDDGYGRALVNIRGIRLAVRSVQAKFKFGGNKAPAHRLTIADRLEARDAPFDLEARDHLVRRLEAQRRGATGD